MVTGLMAAGAGVGWIAALLGALRMAGRVQRANYYLVRFPEWTETAFTMLISTVTLLALKEVTLGAVAFFTTECAMCVVNGVRFFSLRTKFVPTARGLRLLAGWTVINASSVAVLALPEAFRALYLAEIFALYPVTTALAVVIIEPFERLKNAAFLRREAAEYQKLPAIKIAVTGSFGKTTVKELIKAALGQDYTSLATDGNKNTPFGILETVKRYSGEQILITEFGARRKGDIAELIKLFPPDFAVITGVTAQHLESFKSLENITREKFLLAKAVSEERLILNVDNDIVRSVSKEFPRAVTVGKEGLFRISHYREREDGFDFVLNYVVGGRKERLLLSLPLHGRHNASNAALAAVVSIMLGVPPRSVRERLASFKGVPHRFEVKKHGGITIIDDGYNSNIEGVRSGAEAFKRFAGRKVAVAQGLVEAGRERTALNTLVGAALAGSDVVVGVGRNARCIEKGLKSAGFNGEFLRFKSLKAAQRALPALLREGDVVWFQNDLP